MSSALQSLMLAVGLVDNVTGPASRILQSIKKMASGATQSISTISDGTKDVLGAAQAMETLVQPARDFNQALSRVRSLGVTNTALDELTKTALRFSAAYGGSASDFVRSSYKIQSSIAGLQGNELAAFTEAGATLAIATKSDVGTITNYMGTMYGVFKNTADAMGRSNWVQQLAGQTALAVKIFKSSGAQMGQAFNSLGTSATSAGVGAAEQMAILGQLQTKMTGSEAGTEYSAFLAGVGKAQAALNLQFTDSNGRLLGMVDILGKLRGKFGDTLSQADNTQLTKAFGDPKAAAMIQLLMQDTAGLAQNIAKLGNVKGMKAARKMAASMVDPFDRLNGGVGALCTALGLALLPVIKPIVALMAEGAATLTRWTQLFPNLTKWIAVGAAIVIGLAAAVSMLAAAAGIAQFAWIGLTAISAVATAVWGAMTTVLGFLSTAIQVAIVVTRLFGIALLTNPIIWIVVAIVALIAALAALIIYWDDVTAALQRVGTAVLDSLATPLQWIVKLWDSAIAGAKEFGAAVMRYVSEALQKVFELLKSAPGLSLAISLGQKLVSHFAPDMTGQRALTAGSSAADLSGSPRLEVPRGGLRQMLAGGQGGNVYHVNVKSENPMGPSDLGNWMAMNAP